VNIAIPVFLLDRGGGTQRYTWEVARGLGARGHHVTLFAPGGGERPPQTELVTVGHGSTPTSWRGGVHMTTFGARATVRLLLRDRRARRYGPLGHLLAPGLVTIHSVHKASVEDRVRNLGGPGPSAFDRVWMGLERVTYGMSGMRFSAVSPACAGAASAAYDVDPARIAIAPPAVGPEMHPPEPAERAQARARLGLDEDEFTVGTVANYNFETKGVPDLIAACAAIGARLVVAGVDAIRQARIEQHAARLGVRLSLLGHVGDMAAFYRGLDAFVLASRMESYGMAAHEAMACGVATVVTNTCGIIDLFTPGRDALVIERGSVDAIVAALERLRDPIQRAPLAETGTRWATARTWDHVTADIETALQA
jgi:glycosyltransferase involved in cell wall biosynthesis